MNKKIRVTILDDHQNIIDGYVFRLSADPQIEVVATIGFGELLEPTLAEHPTDVLLLDLSVPTSVENPNPYPVLYAIPKLLQAYAGLNILVISMFAERGLIRAVMEAGASGYILKDDQATARDLGSVVVSVAGGSIHFSKQAHQLYIKHLSKESNLLTTRQQEVLSLCAAYPNHTTAHLANIMNISNSTVRNLLSSAYLKLEVNNRAGAIAVAQQQGLITPPPTIHLKQDTRPRRSELLPRG
ncbi:MAG: response regulator transcription factor [Anaerolineales bacterium]|nr:response regulator transcription factor [Anaerolineales bacterium]